MSTIHSSYTDGTTRSYYSSDVVPGSEFRFNVTRFPGTESERLVEVTVFEVVGKVTEAGESLGEPSYGYDLGDFRNCSGIKTREHAIVEAAAVAVQGPGVRYRVRLPS